MLAGWAGTNPEIRAQQECTDMEGLTRLRDPSWRGPWGRLFCFLPLDVAINVPL